MNTKTDGTCISGKTPPRILVVDDYEDNVTMLAKLLDLYGYEVDTALNGPSAIAHACRAKPDVALLDINMPQMDGYEVAGRLRQIYNGDICLIALTALGSPDAQQRAFEAGFDHHLVKPTDPILLEKLLRELTSVS